MASSSPVCAESTGQDLDALIHKYTGSQDMEEKLVFFKSLTHHFLPGLAVVDLEAKFLSRMIPQAYDSIVESLMSVTSMITTLQGGRDSAESTLQKIKTLLQAVVGCIECLEKCAVEVKQMSNQLSLSDIQSLPPAVLRTITSSFEHCKNSESLYGSYFLQFSAELAALFKKTYQLQKVLMELMDKVELHSDSQEKEVLDMAEVCHHLLEICVLISDVDTGLLVNTWKVLNRLVTKHKELLKNHIDVDKILKHLCEAIQAKIIQCVSMATSGQQTTSAGDAKVLSRLLKVVRFLIGHLMHVIKEYQDYIDGCMADLLALLVTLQSIIPSSGSAPSAIIQEITSSIIIVVDPLLNVLINNKSFTRLVTHQATVESRHYDSYGFCQVLFATAGVLTQATEETFMNWMIPTNYSEDEPRLSLFQAIFEAVKKCSVELSLPIYLDGIMCEGKPLRQVSFYESICTKMAALIATTPASCFHVLESCLVETLLQDDALTVLLAADLWAFTARWETADLCKDHVVFLCNLLLSLPCGSVASSNVSWVIRRLTPLMAEQHQESLLSAFPPSKSTNASIWSAIPLDKLSASLQNKACRSIVPVCIKHLHSCLSIEDFAAALHRNIQHMTCLRSVYSLRDVTELVPPVHHAAVLNTINTIWGKYTQGIFKDRDDLLCEVLDLTRQLLSCFQPKEYAQILRSVKSLLTLTSSLGIKIKVAQLLGNSGTMEVTPDIETAVFSNITSLFSSLISDQHWMVHQAALQAIKAFVEVTPHTHIMSDCVPDPLLPLLSDFLSQVPYKQEEFESSPTERDKELLIRQQEVLSSNGSTLGACGNNRDSTIDRTELRCLPTESTDTADNLEPAAKRSRRDHGTTDACNYDDPYFKLLQDMKPHVTALVSLSLQRPPSGAVVQELCSIRETLDSIINC